MKTKLYHKRFFGFCQFATFVVLDLRKHTNQHRERWRTQRLLGGRVLVQAAAMSPNLGPASFVM